MYKAPAAAKLYDFNSANLATMIYPLNDDSASAQQTAAALPATVEGLAGRFALQAFRNSYYDAAQGSWQVSHDRGRTWSEDTGLDYAGGLVTGIIANMILWEPDHFDGATARRTEHRMRGYALSKLAGVHDQVLAAAQEMLNEPYEPGPGDEMPDWTPRDIDYDVVGGAHGDGWWEEGRHEHFRLTGTDG